MLEVLIDFSPISIKVIDPIYMGKKKNQIQMYLDVKHSDHFNPEQIYFEIEIEDPAYFGILLLPEHISLFERAVADRIRTVLKVYGHL